MGTKKKAAKAPKLVAPDPPGDEWEANMAWNRVARTGAPPSFLNGSHVAATDNVFNVRYDVAPVSPPPTGPPSDDGISGQPETARALEAFLRAETQLRQGRLRQKESSDAVDGFRTLAEAEQRHTANEKARLREEWTSALRELDAGETASMERMEALAEVFFRVMDAAKGRLLDLVCRDAEVEDAFAERTATLRACEEVSDAYYAEHAAHVRSIEQLQADVAREHTEELDRMTQTLQDTAFDLLVMATQQDNTREIQQRRTELLVELQRLQQHTPQTLHEREDAVGGTQALRRLVELEEQKLELGRSRQRSLQRAVAALSEAAAPVDRSAVGGSAEAVAADLGEAPLNEMAALRRALDEATSELAAAQEKLEHLQNYHFVQLSGAYKSVNAAELGVRGAMSRLDDETSNAVRALVVKSMRTLAESAHAAREGALVSQDSEEQHFLVPPVHSVRDRLAVQNYIAKQISRLLSGEVPTAPPLTLLSTPPSPSEAPPTRAQ